jgi:hypothetical protein
MRRDVLAVVLVAGLAAAGCGGSKSSTPTCDPVGNWTITDTFGAGNCALTGTLTDNFTVTQTGPGEYSFSDGSGAAISGTISDACVLSAQSTGTSSEADGNIAAGDSTEIDRNYTLSGTTITGSGSVSDTTTACTQQFTVTTGSFAP